MFWFVAGMFTGWFINLSRFEYLRYRYKICNPMPEIINNTPKATNDTSELAFEVIMHKTPLTIQMAGTL
jgi:hypothetical protein